ncbi:MAG: DEAD/DEAH box helicase [Geminicoccales bacterium]
MKQFNDLGLAGSILQAVSAEGYETPTPIQAAVVPAMIASKDILAIAQTGTGKTASFVLPLLDRLAQSKRTRNPKSCGALILAPTRELVAQIAASIRTYGRFTRHSVVVIVGGAKPGPQIRAMARGVDIVVATPGRLLDHLQTGAVHLGDTDIAVLDEGDQMLDLGFMPAIRSILGRIERKRQTVLLSATMPKPIRRLADEFLDDPMEISVAPAARPIERIDQKAMHVDRPGKRQALIDILAGRDVGRAIVFTRTKRGADKVNLQLQKAGLIADALHGNKSQGQRQRILAGFRSGKVKVLVATDIAARGIDVDDVSHVVNYELPDVPEAYVHRIGRTGRAGKSGIAVSLYDSSERPLLRDIEKLIGRRLDGSSDPVDGAAQGHRKGGGGRPKENGSERAPKHQGRSRRRGRPGMGKPSLGKPASGKPGAGKPAASKQAAGKSSAGTSHRGQGNQPRRRPRAKTMDRQAHV